MKSMANAQQSARNDVSKSRGFERMVVASRRRFRHKAKKGVSPGQREYANEAWPADFVGRPNGDTATCDRLARNERLKPPLDFGASGLEEWRQREPFTECFHRFVRGEARAIGGDFEEDSVRLA